MWHGNFIDVETFAYDVQKACGRSEPGRKAVLLRDNDAHQQTYDRCSQFDLMKEMRPKDREREKEKKDMVL